MISKIHNHIYALLLIASLLMTLRTGRAAIPPIRNFGREVTGGGAQNWSITQGDGGVMYFANNGGLLEFDSRKWTLHRMDGGTSARSIFFDAARATLYCGGSGELYACSIAEGQPLLRPLFKDQGVSAAEIWDILSLGHQLYVQDDNAIYRFTDDGSVKTLRPGGRISCISGIGGTLVAALQDGRLLSLNGDRFSPLPGAGMLSGSNIRSLCESGGKLIIVTESDGIFEYAGLTLSRSPLFGPEPPQDIFCATVSDRYFAVGTISDGIYIQQLDGGDVLHLDTEAGLQKNTVLSLYFDRDGDLWAGLDNGIDCICLNAPEWRMFGKGSQFGTGYAVAQLGPDYYFGTSQGLFRTSTPDNPRSIRNAEGIRWQVWSLDRTEDALFCSHDKGLDIFYEDGSVQRIPMDGCWKVEPLRRHPDVLLGCTYDRLFTLTRTNGKWQFNGFVEGFSESSKSFEEDYDGRIWFSHHIKGLYRIRLSDDLSRAETVETFSTDKGFPTGRNNYPNEYGDAIVFSTEGGFFRFDNISGKAAPIDDLNGVFTSVPAVAKVFRPTDSLEFFSSGALQTLRFLLPDGSRRTDSLSVKYLSGKRPLGFESTVYLPGEGLLVNTDEGFSIIRTDRLRQGSRNTSDVFIHTVRLQEEGGDSTLFTARKQGSGNSVRIPYKSTSVSFSFICPQYRSEDAVQYSCILEGFDREWTRLGTVTSKEYTRLPDGSYTFKVRATDGGTVSQTEIRVTVTPPFYKKPLAKVLYAILGLLLLLGLIQLISILSSRRAIQIARKQEEALRQEQTRLELSHKAEELAASTSNLIRKNEILTAIDADLERLKDYVSPGEGRTALRKIRSGIRENIEHDDDWQKFSTNFDLVYNNFLERLGKKYPSLTAADKRLCAYLKMGLSSKDIAPLTDMTVRSVEMTRYRLRKKLSLNRDDNLVKFLQDF